MVEMFKSYDNVPDDYIPNNRPKRRKPRPIINNTNSLSALWPLLNAKEEIIGAEWNYGCAFDLPFEVRGNVIDSEGNLLDLEEFFTGKELKVDILDHFYNDFKTFYLTCEVVRMDEFLVILLEFERDISAQIPRGTYHVRLTLDGDIIYSPLDSVLNCR